MHLCLRKHLQKNQNNNNAVGPSWRSFTCDSMWSKTNFTGVGIPPVSVILKITLKYLFVITCPVIGWCSIRTFIIFTHTMVNLSCREQTCHATRVFHTACSSSQWAQLNPTKRIGLFWYFFPRFNGNWCQPFQTRPQTEVKSLTLTARNVLLIKRLILPPKWTKIWDL